MTLQWIWLGAIVVLVSMTLLPLSRITVWWVRGLDFPRLQLAGLACLLLAGGGVLGLAHGFTLPLAIGLLACLGAVVFHAWWILP